MPYSGTVDFGYKPSKNPGELSLLTCPSYFFWELHGLSRPSSHVPAERTDHYGAQLSSQSLTSLSWGRAVVLKENHSLRCQGHSWSYSEPKQAGCLSSSWGRFPRVMNSADQAALNIIIMKWMHLVSEGFIHWGNEKEVISLFADLLVGHLQNSHGARRLLTWAADGFCHLLKDSDC